MNIIRLAMKKVFGKGVSKSAQRRRSEDKAYGGQLHSGISGQTVKMSDREYFVAADGSFRRIARVGAK